MIPALFTSTSSGPRRASAASRNAAKEAASVTSRREPGRALAEQCGGGRGALLVQVADRHPRAAAHHLGGDRRADAARAAGHGHDASGKRVRGAHGRRVYAGSPRPNIQGMSSTETGSATEAALAPRTRPGAVHLIVTDLDRSVGFYQDRIGLQVHGRGDSSAAMGAGGEDLVILEENAQRPAGRAPRRPLPLRPPAPLARGAGLGAPAPGRDAYADAGRLRPRRVGGALPAGPGRERDRALRGSPARRMARAGPRSPGGHVHRAARRGGPAARRARPRAAAPRRPGADARPRAPARGRRARGRCASTAT